MGKNRFRRRPPSPGVALSRRRLSRVRVTIYTAKAPPRQCHAPASLAGLARGPAVPATPARLPRFHPAHIPRISTPSLPHPAAGNRNALRRMAFAPH